MITLRSHCFKGNLNEYMPQIDLSSFSTCYATLKLNVNSDVEKLQTVRFNGRSLSLLRLTIIHHNNVSIAKVHHLTLFKCKIDVSL